MTRVRISATTVFLTTTSSSQRRYRSTEIPIARGSPIARSKSSSRKKM
jgi:hypothetical protein